MVLRSKTQLITPEKATEYLSRNATNRALSRNTVHMLSEAMRRGEWKVTHQGIAFDADGKLVDGQHRLHAIVEVGTPMEMMVFTDVPAETFAVLDTGKKRNAADVLSIEGERNSFQLATMLRTVWLYEQLPNQAWNGRAASMSNQQALDVLEKHPTLRDYTVVGDQIFRATGMIKTAAGAASYLVVMANPNLKLDDWFEGIITGAGLKKGDPRLRFRDAMFTNTRQAANKVARRRDNRTQLALYLKAFNAWLLNEDLGPLRFGQGEKMPAVATANKLPPKNRK